MNKDKCGELILNLAMEFKEKNTCPTYSSMIAMINEAYGKNNNFDHTKLDVDQACGLEDEEVGIKYSKVSENMGPTAAMSYYVQKLSEALTPVELAYVVMKQERAMERLSKSMTGGMMSMLDGIIKKRDEDK